MATTDILTLSAPILSELARKNPLAQAGFLITGSPGRGRNETVLAKSLAHSRFMEAVAKEKSDNHAGSVVSE